jgi:uncharacterized repeat protein (TIGR03803 family)
MLSAVTKSWAKHRFNTPAAGLRFRMIGLAEAAARHVPTLAVLSLLLISASPALAQTETVLHNFTGNPDGANPQPSLTSHNGKFYGTTYGGGLGYGTVFELSPNGGGGWNETVLYSFTGGEDGGYPDLSNAIFDGVGNLYGTASSGGTNGRGVVFELSPVGASWTETVLYSFCPQGGNCADGDYPLGSVIFDPAGNLYGTVFGCSSCPDAGVFELSPSAGGWTEKLISNEAGTEVGLTMDAAGNIFGGQPPLNNAVFELSPNGGGGWNTAVIYTFANAAKNGSIPQAILALDKAGNLYGTTTYGGAKNYGTVYKLTRGRNGIWTEKLLHSFRAGPKDGTDPAAGIVFDAAGNIYGTTLAGGKYGNGTIFELVVPAVGKTSYTEKILWNFNGTDGAYPEDGVILDSAGHIYGTTYCGGTTYGTGSCHNGSSSGSGVIFEVTP